MSFPRRTPWSDMKAVEVNKALARASKGENFMVACVDTGAVTYVALSGEPSAALLTALQEQLALDKILLGEMPSKKVLEKQKSAAKRRGDEDAFQTAARTQRQQEALKKFGNRLLSAYVVVKGTYSYNGSMMDPKREQVADRIRAYQDVQSRGLEPNVNPLEFAGNRNCAEPKALQAVGQAGLQAVGMTTIWYGSADNPYPDLRRLRTASAAVPCEFCETNAQRIMIHAFR